MAVLSLVVGAVAAAYVLPRLSNAFWTWGTTWLGKTLLTWALVGTVYDLLFNPGPQDNFGRSDLIVTGLITIGIRAVR